MDVVGRSSTKVAAGCRCLALRTLDIFVVG